MKTLSLILICLFAGLLVEAQGANVQNKPVIIRPKILKLVGEIAKDSTLKSAYVGYQQIPTKQWDRYEKLNRICTNHELEFLTGNESPVVRSYAFMALSQRPNFNLFSIVSKHLSDTTILHLLTGDIGSREMVGDFYLRVVTTGYLGIKSNKLTVKEKLFIDSVLFFDKNVKLDSKYRVLFQLKPEIKYYERLKELVNKENDLSALEILARFKNPEDIKVIKRAFEKEENEIYGISAVLEFSDSSFFDNLVNVFNEQWAHDHYNYSKWRILYQALAKYPCNKTLELFEKTINTKDQFRYQTLGKLLTIAIIKYPNDLYKTIKDKIKLDNSHQKEVIEELEYKRHTTF